MQKLFLLTIILWIGFASCSTPLRAPASPIVADGLSFETAIVINETSESAGIREEYRWIREHYSAYQIKRQSLRTYKKHPYDVIQILFSGDRELSLYFDVGAFYGRS